jgi:hypothetical protein
VPWCEDITAVRFGDGVFFSRLTNLHGPIGPILAPDGRALTKEHLFA